MPSPHGRIQETPEQLAARTYAAAMDSVNLINELKTLPARTEEQDDTIKRNVDHLKIVLARGVFTTEDLQPLQDASA